MYSTTHSIMFQTAQLNRHFSLYPFLDELLTITARNYLDNSNVAWVGVMGDTFLPDSESEEEEEYALYPDSDDDGNGDDTEHDDCYCYECERKIDVYEPPFTRLQARNKQTLLDISNKIIESYTQRSYYMFEYMEEQKHYTEWEVEQKFAEHDVYIREQEYRDICESIKIAYQKETNSLKIRYNNNDFIQFLMITNVWEDFITECRAQYKDSIEKLTYLRNNIRIIQK